MEEKIITAIQLIHSKSKQRLTSKIIFQFINKGAPSSECGLVQDCINKWSYLQKTFENFC